MKNYSRIALVAFVTLALRGASPAPRADAFEIAQYDHKSAPGHSAPRKEAPDQKQPDPKAPAKATLLPADGASVKILSPRNGQTLRGDQIPLEFKLVKGKKGEHVHAYVDGELLGMFSSEKGSLNGIKPGQHTLELRVVTGDHINELNAIDRVKFTVK
jgi:hypothetical protein